MRGCQCFKVWLMDEVVLAVTTQLTQFHQMGSSKWDRINLINSTMLQMSIHLSCTPNHKIK